MATKQRLTLEQFLALPETKPASELVDGEVIQKAMPTLAHMIIQRLLSFVFTLYLREHPGGEAGPELRCIFGPPGEERGRVPDFVYVSAARWQGTRGDEPLRGAPDLAVEIVSPDDRPGRVAEKVAFYLLNGVRLVWIIDPADRTVTVLTPDGASHVLGEDDTLENADVLPGFSTVVRDILPPVEPSTA